MNNSKTFHTKVWKVNKCFSFQQRLLCNVMNDYALNYVYICHYSPHLIKNYCYMISSSPPLKYSLFAFNLCSRIFIKIAACSQVICAIQPCRTSHWIQNKRYWCHNHALKSESRSFCWKNLPFFTPKTFVPSPLRSWFCRIPFYFFYLIYQAWLSNFSKD